MREPPANGTAARPGSDHRGEYLDAAIERTGKKNGISGLGAMAASGGDCMRAGGFGTRRRDIEDAQLQPPKSDPVTHSLSNFVNCTPRASARRFLSWRSKSARQ